MMVWKMMFLFNWVIFRFHVILPGVSIGEQVLFQSMIAGEMCWLTCVCCVKYSKESSPHSRGEKHSALNNYGFVGYAGIHLMISTHIYRMCLKQSFSSPTTSQLHTTLIKKDLNETRRLRRCESCSWHVVQSFPISRKLRKTVNLINTIRIHSLMFDDFCIYLQVLMPPPR